MTDRFKEETNGTPLDPSERHDLIPTWIAYREELNQAEQANIAAGTAWARRAERRRGRDILSDTFLRELHNRLFGDVWKWAGRYRTTERNLGVDPLRISVDVRMALDDARHWVDNRTYPPDEIAIRLHHRLVAIHPFPNGNGRSARLIADLLAVRLGLEPFTWGRISLTEPGETRSRYIAALRAADGHDLEPLLAFARS